jgi:hypothetical protein
VNLIIQLLWAAGVLVFIAGAVIYAFNSHLGLLLLKRSLLLFAVVLIGPNLLSNAFGVIPVSVLVLVGVGLSVASYYCVTTRAQKHEPHSGASHPERKPKLPHGRHE